MKLFKLLIAITFLNMILSCSEKIVTVEVEKEYSWKEVTRLTYRDKIIINSGRSENNIYFLAPGYLININLNNGVNTTSVSHMLMEANLNNVLPIKNDCYVNISSTDFYFEIYNVKKKIGRPYLLTTFDSTITQVLYPALVDHERYLINDNNVVMVHYRSKESSDYLNFLLIGFAETNDIWHPLDTSFVHLVKIPKAVPFDNRLSTFFAIDDYYILEIQEQGLYKVEESGNFSLVYPGSHAIKNLFKFNGIIYGFEHYYGDMYKSTDDGINWSKSRSNYGDILKNSKFNTIGDSLVGAYKDNIFTMTFEENNFILQFLNNDGLEHKHITGIEVLGDSVYVGTLSGLFVKPLSTFFEEKK